MSGDAIQHAVSIRAPRERGRRVQHALPQTCRRFQSAPPVRGGDGLARRAIGHVRACFNPRPPCEGATRCVSVSTQSPTCFNPRPPCEGATLGSLMRAL